MAGLALTAAIVCMTLPETYNQPTMEDLGGKYGQDEKEKENGNKNDNYGDETTPLENMA